MHKTSLKRSTFNPLTQKIKAPQHLSQLHQDKNNQSSSRVQLPSLQRKRYTRDLGDNLSAVTQSSAATSASWSPDIEDVGSYKVLQHWESVERTLYNEDNQVTQNPLLEECIQWRSQIPYLRIIGRNPLCSVKCLLQDTNSNSARSQIENGLEICNDQIFSDGNVIDQEKGTLSESNSFMRAEDKVIDLIFEYVISELFPNIEDQTNSLHDTLTEILKISPAPTLSNKSSAKGTTNIWSNVTPNLSRRAAVKNNNSMEDSPPPLDQENIHKNIKQKPEESKMPIRNTSRRLGMNRNKLGTVFNEKIVVSPVPYVLSTRESFSTIRTTPIKFMAQPLTVSVVQGSARNISVFKHSARNSVSSRSSSGYSAWHAPVCPTVWPKNIKLAPIDTSRLPSSKNRSVMESPVLHRNRKSLSPLPRHTLPGSARTIRNNSDELLVIQGKHVLPGRNPKSDLLLSSGWDYTSRVDTVKKKRNRLKRVE